MKFRAWAGKYAKRDEGEAVLHSFDFINPYFTLLHKCRIYTKQS